MSNRTFNIKESDYLFLVTKARAGIVLSNGNDKAIEHEEVEKIHKSVGFHNTTKTTINGDNH